MPYCITKEQRDRQIAESLKRTKKRLVPDPFLMPVPLQIVCFGPSLKDTWTDLTLGIPIMTCSGAHKFLLDHDVAPTHHIEADPREHKAGLIGKPHPDVRYIIASTCHSAVWDLLEGFDTTLWHVYDESDHGLDAIPKGEWAYRGGSSVGTYAPIIARTLGFTDLHIFGMDGCFGKNGESHAADHPSKDPPDEFFYEGKTYLTTDNLCKTAIEVLAILDRMPDVKATFHGEGLVQAMAKNHQPPATPPDEPVAIEIEE